jgi:uncharacterized protein
MDYKLSYYTIFTDPFDADNTGLMRKQIAFSTRTGQVLVISEKTCDDILDERWHNLSAETLQQLTDLKFIVPTGEDELSGIINENKQSIEQESMLYYVIQPTAYCQLGCDYCGQEHKKRNLSKETEDGIMARIASRLVPGKHQHIRIGWFGGEPLLGLKQMRELTPRLKALAAEHNIGYSSKVVTNGLSRKEDIYMELVDELAVDQVEVTLDGIAEFHDQRRHTKSVSPTFGIIFDNLKAIINRPDYLEKRCRISIRCNVDERNWEGVSPLIRLLADEGFVGKISHFYPIGVYSWGNDAHKKSLTKEEFAQKEIDWLMEMYEVGFKPSLIPGRVRSVCLAVSPTSEMIDAYGNIFNCTEVSYVPVYEDSGYVLGNVNKPANTYAATRPLTDWNDRVLNNEVPCTACKMLPVCGGCCPKSWHEDRRACPPSKFNIKDKLLLSYLSVKENFKEMLEEVN